MTVGRDQPLPPGWNNKIDATFAIQGLKRSFGHGTE
jgi:hypothetical protein